MVSLPLRHYDWHLKLLRGMWKQGVTAATWRAVLVIDSKSGKVSALSPEEDTSKDLLNWEKHARDHSRRSVIYVSGYVHWVEVSKHLHEGEKRKILLDRELLLLHHLPSDVDGVCFEWGAQLCHLGYRLHPILSTTCTTGYTAAVDALTARHRAERPWARHRPL